MKVMKFPVSATERWTLSRDLDNLRFDILSARAVADRLREKDAAQYLAASTSAENIQNTLANIVSIFSFVTEVSERMRQAGHGESTSTSGPVQ
jgi:hypothetical protein